MFGFGGLIGYIVADLVADVVCDTVGIDRGPSVMDKIELMFTDVGTEGRKQGYVRAAEEYDKAYAVIEAEYAAALEMAEEVHAMYSSEADRLNAELRRLEAKRERLDKERERKIGMIATAYGISTGTVRSACVGGTGINTGVNICLFELAYRAKSAKLERAEREGYEEAKKIHEEKLEVLRRDFQTAKAKARAASRKYMAMIEETLSSIAREQTEITELSMML